MSDEPNPKDQSETKPSNDWVMPAPTFRSSEGYTPGSPKSEVDTDEFEADGETTADDLNRAITEEMPVYKSKQKRNGGGGTWLLIFGIIALLAAAAIAVYYLLMPTRVDPTF